MKLIHPLLAAGLLSTGSAFASKTIAWVSDQLVQNAGSDASDNDGTPLGRFSSGAGPYADEAFVTLLRNAGYSVTRYNPPNNTPLPADEVTTLNTFDLVILSRGIGSGSFDSAAEALAWNSSITKPLLCTNTYLTRSNRLGWFSAATPTSAPVQPDQLLNPLTFTDLSSPVQAYLATGLALTGSTTNDSITEVINFPVTAPNNGAADVRGISNLTGSTINAGGTVLANAIITASSNANSPFIASLPSQTILTTTGTAAVAAGQALGGYRLQFLAGIRESATAPNNGVRNAGFESMTVEGEKMLLRAIALAMNSGVVPADADADGLIDSWETTHFGGPAVTTGLTDTDGDGLNNLLEYAFGLNPNSGDLTAFSLGHNVTGGFLELSISKRPYCCYVIEASSDLVNWSAAGLSVITDDATTLRVRESATTNRRHFRARVYPMPLP